VINNDKEFRIHMDVQHFKPEEIKITSKDNRVVINARHEERPDEHGFIMREFTRQYVLPKVS
jgi:HSP20 family molecular chaperone IbpA